MTQKPKVLLVDDEPLMRVPLADRLLRVGYDVTALEKGEDALSAMAADDFDVAVVDLRLPGISGLDVLRGMQALGCTTDAVVITAHGTIETAVEAMKLGARDFITKPFPTQQLLDLVERYARVRIARASSEAPAQRTFCGMIAVSDIMREVFRLIDAVADSNTTIIIQGETGTGKELVASAIQQRSSRRSGPYVKVNCASVPEPLFESELFGHEKGAFTGADRRRKGRFELAARGTLLLDEVDEMPLWPQAKVLRAIQEHEIDRLGGSETVKLDVRLLATTKVDLRDRVADGRFREDLYYRLNVLPVVLPPLRERLEDIPHLAEHLRDKLAQENRRPARGFSKAALAALQAHAWPGNVRELQNAVARAVMLCPGDTIEPAHLGMRSAATPSSPQAPSTLAMAVQDAEYQRIREALQTAGGHRGRAAEMLGISRKTLWQKLNRTTR